MKAIILAASLAGLIGLAQPSDAVAQSAGSALVQAGREAAPASRSIVEQVHRRRYRYRHYRHRPRFYFSYGYGPRVYSYRYYRPYYYRRHHRPYYRRHWKRRYYRHW